ncbi:hypothetical protein [Streptomyces sulphureus]|uniref:hypothetical protein n=1 Tax=Streptomyces sulphureus TaxID=47758 RepID=UPI00039D946A|nr:hypothetical protein [Streptomyces sulphureus]
MTASLPSRPSHGAPDADFDRYAPRLLLWVSENSGADSQHPVDCTEFRQRQSLDPTVLDSLVDHLAGLGFLRRYTHYGSSGEEVVLEPAGVEQVGRLNHRRQDENERWRYAQDALLDWLGSRRGQPGSRIGEFHDSPQVFFLGDALSSQEVAAAVDYLVSIDLVAYGEEDALGGRQLSLTDDGREFVWGGARLDDYLRQRRERQQPVMQTVIHQANKVQIAGRDLYSSDVTYSIELNSQQLAVLIREMAPQLHLPEGPTQELVRLSDQLALQDDSGGEEAQTRSGGVLQRMRQVMSSASNGAAKELLDLVMEQVMSRAMGG